MFGGMMFFWVLLLVVLGVFLARLLPGLSQEDIPRRPDATPLETLRRRYASGEVSAEDYQERKAQLERDQL